MCDIDAAGMSHIGPKKDIVRERVARSWHEGSDHAADGVPFGGPLCNCWQVTGRIMPMLRDAEVAALRSVADWLGGGDHTEDERCQVVRLNDDGTSWLMHGHTHSSERVDYERRQIHVGLDAWALQPVPLNALTPIFKELP